MRIMHNGTSPAPTRYGVLLSVMREYGWTWRDIEQSPTDLVEEVCIRMQAEHEFTDEKRKRDAAMKAQGF